MYEIRLCQQDELDLLKSFLESSWSNTHIFLKDQKILDFQHKAISEYNFVVAYHKETQRFHGVLGIVSPNFYLNRKIATNEDVWLAIWKVDKELAQSNSLGIDLLNYVDTKFKPNSVSAIGINHTVALLYRLIGFKVKKMNQWFIPNSRVEGFKLVVGDLMMSSEQSATALEVIEFAFGHREIIDRFLSNDVAKQSFQYLSERYLNHPTYKYQIFGFFDVDKALMAIVVGRAVSAKGSKAFRVTELFVKGPKPKDLSSWFRELMCSEAYEYIDFLEYGFDDLTLQKSGFILCTENLYVPHLFEPFVSDKQDITIAFRSAKPFSCTKGDSDLDRPNQRKKNYV